MSFSNNGGVYILNRSMTHKSYMIWCSSVRVRWAPGCILKKSEARFLI